MYQSMESLSGFALVLVVLTWLACGAFAGYVAAEKARSGFFWFCAGLVFGPMGLLAVVGLPDRSTEKFRPSAKTHGICPDCGEFVRKTAKVCGHCGCKLDAEQAPQGGLQDLQNQFAAQIGQHDEAWIPSGYEDKA